MLEVCTATLTLVWIPARYPDPLLPILIEDIVPAIDTIAVPPAATRGWYPNPSVDPTERTTPPKGRFDVFGSDEIEVAVPVNLIEVIPEFSVRL